MNDSRGQTSALNFTMKFLFLKKLGKKEARVGMVESLA
jgi:hypothetical protein